MADIRTRAAMLQLKTAKKKEKEARAQARATREGGVFVLPSKAKKLAVKKAILKRQTAQTKLHEERQREKRG